MAKNKNKNKNVAGENSKSVKTTTLENLKALNSKLLKEVVECRREIEELRHQLIAVTEKVDAAEMRMHAAFKEKAEAEMRLLATVKDNEKKTTELADIRENIQHLLRAKEITTSEQQRKSWRKWLCPIAAFLAGTTLVILGCRITSYKN